VEVTRIGVDTEGLVAVGDVRDAVRPDQTVLVTIMHSNNEVGSIQPIKRIVKAVKFCSKKVRSSTSPRIEAEPLCLVHTDAAQSIGKVVVDVADLGVDLATIVGHKFGCPKGVAALFVKQGTPFVPMFFGGGQEAGRRAGTENVLLIAAIGKAADVVKNEADGIAAHMGAMRERLLQRLIDGMGSDSIRTNGPADPAKRLPNTLSVGIKGASAISLLAALSEKVAASASAACHTGGKQEVSAILRAMKVPEEFALGTLRLSVGRHTTPAEIDLAASLILAEAKQQQCNDSA
jgi:cysteine desulfurase